MKVDDVRQLQPLATQVLTDEDKQRLFIKALPLCCLLMAQRGTLARTG